MGNYQRFWRWSTYFDEGILNRIPAGRWAQTEDLKGLIVYLTSAASDYVNGEILTIDGGWMAR